MKTLLSQVTSVALVLVLLVGATLTSAPAVRVVGASYPDGTFLGATDTGRTYRMAGGAPLYITNCAPFNNCAGRIDVDQATINSLGRVPVDGTFLGAADSGRTYEVAGGAPLYVTTCAPLNNCAGRIDVNQGTIDQLDHLNAHPANGTILGAADSGHTYVVAGGAPLYVTTCAPLNNCAGRVNVTQGTIDQLDHLNARPTDGTFLGAADSGRTYVVAGGAPLFITSCNVVNNCVGRVNVTQGTIDLLDHLDAVPANGTLLGAADSGRSYVVAGGAPLYVTSCAPLNNCLGRINVAQGTIDSLDHLYARPTNGTFLGAADSGRTYEVAGGAPLFITSCNVVNNCAGRINVTQGTIDQLDHLNARPIDGTFLGANDSGRTYEVAGGAPLFITSCNVVNNCPGRINITQGTIDSLDHLNARPVDGTFLGTADSGQTYVVAGGAPLYVTTCAPLSNCAGRVNVTQRTIDQLDHLRAVPANGTFLGAVDSGRTYEVAGGAPLFITSCNVVNNCAGRVNVTQGTIDQLDHLKAVPANGTVLRADDTGNVYLVNGGAPLYLSGCDHLFLSVCNDTYYVHVAQWDIDHLDHMNASPVGGSLNAHVEQLITIASPYIMMSGVHASIQPALQSVISSPDYAIVSGMVASYNSLMSMPAAPAQTRYLTGMHLQSLSGTQAILNSSCRGQRNSYWVINWYGPAFYANECMATSIRTSLDEGTQGVTFVGFMCAGAGPAAPVCGAAAGSLVAIGTFTSKRIADNDRGRGVWLTWIWGVSGALLPEGVNAA